MFSKNSIITALLLAILTALFFSLAGFNVAGRERRAFRYEAGRAREAALAGVNAGDAVAHSVRALFLSSENVDADEFRVFAEELFARYPFIRAGTYYPMVYEAERAAFTRSQRDRGFVGYDIHTRKEGGGLPAAVRGRGRYLPVQYREPFSPEAAALFGYDILTRPGFAEILQRCIRRGVPVPSPPITLPDGSAGYELFIAVYEGKQIPPAESLREMRVNGMISFSIDPEAFFPKEKISGRIAIAFSAEGASASATSETFFQLPERMGAARGIRLSSLFVSHRVAVGEQRFVLTVRKGLHFVTRDLWQFAMGLTAALLLSAGYFYFLKVRAHRLAAERAVYRLNTELESRVAARTRELKESLETLKRAQDQLVMSEKMAALGALVAGVAHEINTPVGIGITEVSFLIERTAQVAELYRTGKMARSDLTKYLDHCQAVAASIQTNLDRAGMLVRSFKQVAVDQSREEIRRFNLKQYIEEVLLSLHARIKRGAHTVTVTCPADLTIESYPGVFAQIITNLVMNALLHGFADRKGGSITIAATISADSLSIDFSDDGMGMEEGTCRRIFDPFFTTARGEGGTGLGMHIVYNLIAQTLGGQVTCHSLPAKGTAFHILVPLTPPDRSA